MPHDNPLGLDGFEFVEFTSPDPEALGGPVPPARLRPSRRSQDQAGAPLRAGRRQLPAQHGAVRARRGFPGRPRPFGERDGLPGEGRRGRRWPWRSSGARRRSRANTACPRSKGSAAPTSIWSTVPRLRPSTTATSSPPRGRRRRRRRACTRSTTSPTTSTAAGWTIGRNFTRRSSISARSAISTSKGSRPRCSRGR